MSTLGSAIPSLDYCVYFTGPRHRYRRAGNVDYYHGTLKFSEGFDKFVLSVRKNYVLTVRSFVVLEVALVEASDKDDAVGILRGSDSVCLKLCGAAALAKVLTRHYPVVVGSDIAHIAALPDHLRLAGESLTECIQRDYFILCLQVRRATAHDHHLISILPHYEYFR